ncbi:MAG TPA: GNAT family N-acetyltransferase [Legionella sp.]|nr:GNAT family N-acetyltransferase [Legionella sp.]
MMCDLFDIEWNDVGQVAEKLVHVFTNYPMHQWIFATERNTRQIEYHFNRAWIKYCIKYGIALKTSNLEAILLAKKPGDVGFNHLRNIRCGLLKIPFLVNKETLKRLIWLNERVSDERKRIMGNQKHWYLWIMATSPDKVRQGFGHSSLQYLIQLAQNQKLPIYLQTSSSSAINFYLAHGFEVRSNFLIDNQFSITTMVYQGDL